MAQIDVKSAGGNGRKVTGLVQAPLVQGPYGNEMVYVITSADSRIRLFVGYLQVVWGWAIGIVGVPYMG